MKNHKYIKFVSVLFCLILLFVVCCSTPASALSQYDSVSITTVEQAKSNWCWAACAEMLARNIKPSTTYTQYDIVKYIKGTSSESYPNVTANASELRTGARYASGCIKGISTDYSVRSFSQIWNSIGNGYAVVASSAYYNSSNIRTNGHAVVIYATQFIDGSSGSSYYIDYIDPADGSRNHCTYSSFCDGTFNDGKYEWTVYVN